MAFEGLTEKISSTFKKLRGKGRLKEADVKEAMREIRMALLEADVSYKVCKDFTKQVTERCVGTDVLESLTPAQMIVKIVNEELTALMGGFFATRIYHLPPLGAGLINGILITVLSLLFSFFFAKNADFYATGYSAAVSALLHAGAVGLSIGGAFIGAREKTPTKRRKKARR